jgi:hypothetical protein
MFDQKQTDAFRSITAPEELRERVLAMEQKKPRNSRRIIMGISSAAACLLILAAIPFFGRTPQKNPVFSVNGTTLAEEAMLLSDESSGAMTASARTVQKYTAVISAEFPTDTTLAVSDGRIELTSIDSSEVIGQGEECKAKGEVLIRWTVDIPEKDAQYYLTADTDSKEQTITLYYDSASNLWYINQTADKTN